MKRARWHIRTPLIAGAIATIAPALFFAERLAENIIQRALAAQPGLAGAPIITELRAAFVVLSFVALLLVAAVAHAAGGRIRSHLRRMRTGTLERSKGKSAVLPRSRIAELDALGAAIDLLTAEYERRQSDLALERNELALLVTSVSEGILQIGAGGRLVHANPAARTLLGLRAEGRGQPLAAIVRHAELRQILEAAARGQDIPAREINLDERRLLVTARPALEPVPDGPARPAGAVVAFTDITEIRRLEGVRRDFVANVSHELKTPLTSIRGYVETLLTDELPLPVQRQFLDVIRTNAERLHGIVDDLLDLSRLESGGWQPQPQSVDAIELANDVWHGLRHRRGAKTIRFAPSGKDIPVLADPGGLRQVLSNLLDNAVRYTPEGGTISVRIRRAARNGARDASGAFVDIEIEDTGIGIPGDALPRIFERFYRVDPARSRAEGGTGLGLSIVKHLVESMGGEIEASSRLGKGSTFRIRLPAA